MAINYSRMTKTAEKLITQNGRTVTLVKRTRTPADPNKPWEGPTVGTETTVDVKAVFVVPASEERFGRKDFDNYNSPHRGAEEFALISAKEAINDIYDYDLMRDGTTVWRIIFTQTLKPGGTSIIYQLGLVR